MMIRRMKMTLRVDGGAPKEERGAGVNPVIPFGMFQEVWDRYIPGSLPMTKLLSMHTAHSQSLYASILHCHDLFVTLVISYSVSLCSRSPLLYLHDELASQQLSDRYPASFPDLPSDVLHRLATDG